MANILLAEDDHSMRHFLAVALERAGHDVEPCENGVDALKRIENESNEIDLLLADIVMPGGLDGIELSHQAKKIRPDLKIIFITGFAAVPVSHTKIGNEKTQVLSKSFHLSEIVDHVNDLLENTDTSKQ